MGRFEFQNSSPSLMKMLEFSQAAPQKQPEYLSVAAASQLSPQEHAENPWGVYLPVEGFHSRAGAAELRARTDANKMKELAPKSVGVESWRPAPAGHRTSVCG